MAQTVFTSQVGVWRPRSLYTMVFTWISVVGGRFLVIFLEQQARLTAAELGTILALGQVVSLAASSMTGTWADLLEQRYPNSGRAMMFASGILLGGTCFMLHSISWTSIPPVLWHGFLRLLFSVSTAMIFPVMDGMCLDYLEKIQRRQDYGRERMYGAISWGVASMVIAVGLDSSMGISIFYILAIFSTLGTILVVGLYAFSQAQPIKMVYRHRDSNIILEDDPDLNEPEISESGKDIPGTRDIDDGTGSQENTSVTKFSTLYILYLLITSWFGIAFVVSQITQSSGQAIVDNLIFLYFEELGSSYTLMGLTVVLTVAFEIPIFHMAPQLLERYGPGPLIPVAGISYVVRVVGYSLIPQGKVIHVLWLEPLHGVTFACMSTAGVELVSSLVTLPGYQASGQAALQILIGTGSVLGLWLGGWSEEILGPRTMYRIIGGIVFAGCTIFSLALCRCPPLMLEDRSGGSPARATDKVEKDADEGVVELVCLVKGQGISSGPR